MKKSIILHACLICLIFNSYGQRELPQNNPNYDMQTYHFGFILGYSQQKLNIRYSEFMNNYNDYLQILSDYEPGFNVGIIMDFKIKNNFNIRVTPSFNFTDQKIYYNRVNYSVSQPQNSGLSNFELPIYLKYRSDRVNNGRLYVLLGPKLSIDMSSFEKLSDNENLEFKSQNYSLDIGFGIDIYFKYFKFAPEIKYSYGITNILEKQHNEYDNYLNSLSSRSILISLTFE
ncbi:MAG: porin family protein [Bacteroidota bacterium]|nr:porin family protein [Bacteroidota bacterium]